MNSINIQVEQQQGRVADEVSALIAVIRPILHGLLFAIKNDVVNETGGIHNLKLFMLPRVYRPGSGDCGICFEYAVHDAIQRKDPMIIERVHDSLTRFVVYQVTILHLFYLGQKKPELCSLLVMQMIYSLIILGF